MKRKSGQTPTSKRRKSSEAAAHDAVVIREGPGFTQLTLPPGEGVIVSGCAALEVVSGCVRVFGAFVTPDHGRVRLTAPARHGRALLISAVPAEAQAPLAQPTEPVQAVLHSVTPQPAAAAAAAAAAAPAAGGALSFSVVDGSSADAPAAWQTPPQWLQAADALAEAAAAAAAAGAPFVVAVTGCKGCGKSAAARLIANSLISSSSSSSSSSSGGVVYIDLDPGQPELTPAGLLSLHLLQQPLFGPSHMQQQEPLLAFFQGDVSSQSEPGRYLQAVQALLSRYYSMVAAATAAQQPPPPLVINTPGWITGLGLELLAEALRCAGPSYVVDIRSPNSKKNLPEGCWWFDSATAAANLMSAVLQLQSVASAAAGAAVETPAKAGAAAGSCFSTQSGDTVTTAPGGSSSSKAGKSMSAVDTRALSWLAWARRVIAASAAAQQEQQQAAVQQSPALAAQCSAGIAAADAAAAASADGEEFQEAAAGLAAALPFAVCLRDVSVELPHAQVQQSELPLALNGALVGLASSRSSSSSLLAGNGGKTEQQGVAALGPQLHECLGVGLVRAVDAQKGLLYLLTDMNEQRLQEVDVLMVGRLELPEKLSVTQQLAPPYQSLFCLGSAATGAGLIKSRNNLLRASMLRQ